MMSDIIQEIRNGNKEAVKSVYQQYAKDVYNFSKSITGDHDTALAATKKTFLNLFHNIRQGEEPQNLRTAALKIAYDEAYRITTETVNIYSALKTAYDDEYILAGTNDEGADGTQPAEADAAQNNQDLGEPQVKPTFEERTPHYAAQDPGQEAPREGMYGEPVYEEQQPTEGTFAEPANEEPPHEENFDQPAYEDQPYEGDFVEPAYQDQQPYEGNYEEPVYEDQQPYEGNYEEPVYEDQPYQETYEEPAYQEAAPASPAPAAAYGNEPLPETRLDETLKIQPVSVEEEQAEMLERRRMAQGGAAQPAPAQNSVNPPAATMNAAPAPQQDAYSAAPAAAAANDVDVYALDEEEPADYNAYDYDDELTKKPRSKGLFVFCIILNIVLIVILLWFLGGLLVNLGVLPNIDLGYSWFNQTIYPLF